MTFHDYWPRFIHFVKAERAAHGPDCQLELLLETVPEDTSLQEKVWLCGIYGAHHTVLPCVAIWNRFRPQQVLDDQIALRQWLDAHWYQLDVRREMRSHRMLDKRTECLIDFARYTIENDWSDPTWSYEDLWNDSQSRVKYYGRYMAIKYLEILRRVGATQVVLTDMRSAGGWSPRRTLGLLWPEHADVMNDRNDNSEEAIELAEALANKTIARLAENGVVITHFQIQVLLCNFREMLPGGSGFYPGAGHDEEMTYMQKGAESFQAEIDHIYATRKRIFPHTHLGELNDPPWDGLRKSEYDFWRFHPEFQS